jgi:hypothetical protein
LNVSIAYCLRVHCMCTIVCNAVEKREMSLI